MASKPLEAYINSLKESQAMLQAIQSQWVKEKSPLKKAHLKKQVEQWTNKCLYITEQLLSMGTHYSIVEVSGKVLVNNEKIGIQREFSLYLTGLTIEDAKVYFQNIVKTKWENIILETISFKYIPVGVIQINYFKP